MSSLVAKILTPFKPNNISSTSPKTPQKKLNNQTGVINRRRAIALTTSTMATLVVLGSNAEKGGCFDFRMTVPDQTLEEAESMVRGHAQELLSVRDLIEEESWREAQRELRKSSTYLKQDVYTIIQAKPGGERPLLRKLYSQLFNNVTRLDYAARSEDAAQIQALAVKGLQ
ncbi:hypothetical protein Scep_016015 [Stephania cephalantha]|uniref:PsbQ-like protein 3, chloroplastic n=1 Tax=Stephania cephalantha TaxID=152367 RepID=A0AAP0NS76_9MAGN